MRLLLVEDDGLLGEGICQGLRNQGYCVDWVREMKLATAAFAHHDYQLIILDLVLPDDSGMVLLRRLRERGNEVPVMIVSARDTVRDRVSGLDTGADEYLVKPFDFDELSARVRALLRRYGSKCNLKLQSREVTLDPASRQVTYRGKRVSIPKREFDVLQLLLRHQGKTLSTRTLEDSLYAWDEEIESNTVQVYVHNIRKLFGKDFVRTVRGVGYIVDNEPQTTSLTA